MYNLLVSGRGWVPARDDLFADRVLEYTEAPLIQRFRPRGQVDFAALCKLPTLFVDETSGDGEHQVARVGTITRARFGVREVALEYNFDSFAPPLTNALVKRMARDLDIVDFEFSRTHWAVKDVDLYRVLVHSVQPRKPRPRVFTLRDPETIEPLLVSAMMPFHPHFDAVYDALRQAAESTGLRCRRADDIWENPGIIQDVVSLIDRSRIVISDCTGRNPNVFYETGIADALGREVVLVTQNDADIPFDLRHLRYVRYLNNGEGLRALADRLQPRLRDLTAS
jgi:hypothetical protein